MVPTLDELLYMQERGVKQHNLERISYHWKRLTGLTFFFNEMCSPPMGTYMSEPIYATDLLNRKPATITITMGTFFDSKYLSSIAFAQANDSVIVKIEEASAFEDKQEIQIILRGNEKIVAASVAFDAVFV